VFTKHSPRYLDLYFSEEETKKAVEEIASNIVLSKVGQDMEAAAPAAPLPAGPDNALARRRAQLLASKQTASQLAAAGPAPRSILAMVTEEKLKLVELRNTVALNTNPQTWWKEHQLEFPLLARYYRAYCAFQATSTASERVYNVEALVFSRQRSV
jgi:hypothetical protein